MILDWPLGMGVIMAWPSTHCAINPVYLMAFAPSFCWFHYRPSHCLPLSWEGFDSDEFNIVPSGMTEQGCAVPESWTCLLVIMEPRAIPVTFLGHYTFVNLHHDFNYPDGCVWTRCDEELEARLMEESLPMCLPTTSWQAHWHTFCTFLMCLWGPENWFLFMITQHSINTLQFLSGIISYFLSWTHLP